MERFLIPGLVVAASISPLLTFAHLWQVKEWRIDRLREHLRAERALRQIFGIVRPAVFGFCSIIGVMRVLPSWPLVALATIAALGAVQIGLGKQPMPVWTKKALVLVGTALFLTLFAAATLAPTALALVAAFPLLQPAFLALGWTLFFPVDFSLKRRIMNRAKRLRAAHPELVVIGITGSVGKTTTKELIAHILKERNPAVTPAYVNTEMGVSSWLIRELDVSEPRNPQPPPTRIAIVEMGAYRRGEIKLLSEIVKPTVGIVTFIGSQHISLFGSKDALIRAKAELLDALPENGHAFLNGDSEHCNALREHCRCAFTTVGTGDTDIEAFDIEETRDGIRFRIGESTVVVPMHGTHNVSNVLLAIAAAEFLGMGRKDILARLRTFAPLSHTFSVRKEGTVTVLDDTHNASPESFTAAIAWARSQPQDRKSLLTPGLIELGMHEDDIHMELGLRAAKIFSRVIFTHNHNAGAFAKGYGNAIELLSKRTEPVAPESLLVCVGAVTENTMRRLLPPARSP